MNDLKHSCKGRPIIPSISELARIYRMRSSALPRCEVGSDLVTILALLSHRLEPLLCFLRADANRLARYQPPPSEGQVIKAIRRLEVSSPRCVPSSAPATEPNEFISEWQKGVAKAQSLKPMDRTDTCLWGTVFGLFDSVEIHSMVTDPVSANWGDLVTAIPTNRRINYFKCRIREDDSDDWYVMVPPLVNGPSAHVACPNDLTLDSNAPLTQWNIEGSFHGNKECESEGNKSRKLGKPAVVQNAQAMSRFTRKESADEWSWSLPVVKILRVQNNSPQRFACLATTHDWRPRRQALNRAAQMAVTYFRHAAALALVARLISSA